MKLRNFIDYIYGMKRKVTVTNDGSSTIYIPELDEHYHSSHGAIQEARHVFLKHGIETLNATHIDVFEMGLGTGLNALLTFEFAEATGVSVNYIGIEAYPVAPEMVNELNYVDEINPEYKGVFEKMHDVEWGKRHALSDRFSLTKIHEKIEEFAPEPETADIVYFDAFGPRAQGDMWDLSVLSKMKLLLKPGGLLVTYCAKGQFKRDLKSLGFAVKALPGPPGKREMTVGTLIQ